MCQRDGGTTVFFASSNRRLFAIRGSRRAREFDRSPAADEILVRPTGPGGK